LKPEKQLLTQDLGVVAGVAVELLLME